MEKTPVTIEQALDLNGAEALDYFTKSENIDQLAIQVRDEAFALSVIFNPETKSGRDGIGSTALKVSKSKKVITDKLDQAAAKHKEALAKITTAKKRVENKFKEIRTEVLRPRDEWQAEQDRIECERVSEIKQRIENIRRLGDFTDTDTKEQLSEKIEVLNGIEVSNGFEEFYWDATNAIKEQIAKLHDRIVVVAKDAQRKAEQEKINLARKIAEIKQYPLLYIGKTSDEIREGKELLNENSYNKIEVTFGGNEEIKTAVNDANEQLDKMIEQAEQAERNHDNKPKKDTLNIHQNVESLLSDIQSGNRSMYCVWVDVLETLQSRRMYPVIAKSEEEARSHIEKSLGMLGEKLDHKDCVIINKHVDIGQVFEVTKH